MASINSPIRTFIKPLFYKFMPSGLYAYFQYLAKSKDIKEKLVEEEELQILPLLLDKNSNCLDIGANFAYISERLSKLCPDGQIYAFEPIPFTYKVAAKIIKKFGLKNVKLFQLGVGNENTQMTFEVPLQDFGAYSSGQAHITGRKNNELKVKGHYKFNKFESVTCNIIRLDGFNEIKEAIDFIKIDIEGAEYYAILGMEALLLRDKPSIYMEINPDFLKAFDLDEAILIEKMHSLGYDFYEFDKSIKLKLVDSNFVEANYFLIHRDNKDRHSDIIL